MTRCARTVSRARQTGSVTTPDVRGLERLEHAVLDDNTPLATALRQCLMLAGYAQHRQLRGWALKELEGYPSADELPPTAGCRPR
ncbi:AbiTii domain-containing protein [Actinacidiphila sp. DG2A-62]|uniref:AbiTii domain-containing protein n=1 Tax=Actinacidiphila sp. DG2A-62 TaxID=3108821 RepID=UPI003FA37C80